MKSILGGLVLALALAGCGGGGQEPTVDHARLVSGIKRWAVNKQEASPSIKVSCPNDIPQKAGTVFHCLLSGGGQTVRLTVTVENDNGYMTWTTS